MSRFTAELVEFLQTIHVGVFKHITELFFGFLEEKAQKTLLVPRKSYFHGKDQDLRTFHAVPKPLPRLLENERTPV